MAYPTQTRKQSIKWRTVVAIVLTTLAAASLGSFLGGAYWARDIYRDDSWSDVARNINLTADQQKLDGTTTTTEPRPPSRKRPVQYETLTVRGWDEVATAQWSTNFGLPNPIISLKPLGTSPGVSGETTVVKYKMCTAGKIHLFMNPLESQVTLIQPTGQKYGRSKQDDDRYAHEFTPYFNNLVGIHATTNNVVYDVIHYYNDDRLGLTPYLPAGACETLTVELPTADLAKTYLVFGKISNPRETMSVERSENFDEFLARGEAIRLNPGGQPLQVRIPKDYYSIWED